MRIADLLPFFGHSESRKTVQTRTARTELPHETNPCMVTRSDGVIRIEIDRARKIADPRIMILDLRERGHDCANAL